MGANVTLADSTPLLIGAGQVVEREATDSSPMQLAAAAAGNALADSGAPGIASAIDTISVTRLFSDMGLAWPCKWGRSNNPPQSIAHAIGATPEHRIYSQEGGNQPQSRVIEFARDIARGDRSMVLLAGAEALKNQRHAERNQRQLDWNEHFEEPLEDRGISRTTATRQELKSGLTNVAYYYALIEQAQRHKAGRSVEQHQQAMAALLASFSAVAADNPYAQFAGSQSADDITSAPALTHLYTKRMIAQDGVNQAAALLMCSVGKARELGIPESKWIFMHGLAEGVELELTCRADTATSPMAGMVAKRVLEMAGLGISDIDLIDIYSCFPCAITAVCDHLDLPTDGSQQLTLTGGLPYFGGPGNNYSMHGIAEAVWQCRQKPGSFALVTCNGGVLSKHASAVYSNRPSTVDWASQETSISNEQLQRFEVAADPGSGRVISYTVHFDRDGSAHAIALAGTDNGEHFVCCTAADDQVTPAAMLAQDPSGQRISVAAPIDELLHFQLES